ncbi:replicative DNA helicase [Desulfovibrio oxamicus]|uniref:Replicative DNA helicase n=1 Tax=Nitratidesulfovibrio oxamicus TaxID=32016 RepID=A0ABS0J093_9BACT|nr:replicative DNA helicase [Nitratidesulfovibrio oxamicus]
MPQNPSWKPSRKPRPNSHSDSDAASAYQGGGGAPDPTERASADLLRRVPPHSTEAEQAVLGGILLRNSVLHSVVDTLRPEDFYLPAHQQIYDACLELYRRNAPIDLVTMAEYLQSQSRLEGVGGAVYLAELAQSTISAANAEHYSTIVRDKSLLRSLIGAGSEIISNCYDASREVQKLLDESEQAVFAISERVSGKMFRSAKELVNKVFEDLVKRCDRKEVVTGVTTGFVQLDQMTSGLQPSDLIIVAARPSMGKTAFALNMCLRAAVNQNTPVAVYSLEMSMEQLVMRMLCSLGKVDLSKVRKGFLDDEDWQRLYHAADVLSQAPVYIDDTPAITTLELRARTRRLKAERGVGLVMVDYLQLMRSARRVDSRELEISEISRSLKALAKELYIPVIALSQLNRKVEERTNKRPMLSDLRESGAIEQDADVIMFIYRDDAYNKRDDNPRKGIAEIIIGKQRNGPVGVAELAYLPAYTAFEDLTFVPPPPSEGYGD